jgi:hypothetical protein
VNNPCNGFDPTPIRIVIEDPRPGDEGAESGVGA